MVHRTLLTVCMVLVVGQLWHSSSTAKIVTITDIKPGFPENPHYGEIIREIRVEGNKHTHESVIRKALKSQVGHIYTEENAKKDMLWVTRLGSFTAVAFSVEPVTDGIILTVTVAEASPYIPSLSFKLTQQNGVEIGPAFSSPNLFGTAAKASVYARFGGATNIGIRYSDPQLPGQSLLWGYSFYYFHRERYNPLLDYQETSDEFRFEFKQSTSDIMRTGLRFRYTGLGSDKAGITLDPDNYDKVPSLGIFVQQDTRNSVYPTDGWFLDLELSKWGIFGGNGDWWRLDVDVRRYMQVPGLGRRHSLAIYAYAALLSGQTGVTIPTWQEFFIGGTNSVRGWELGSLEGQNQWLNTIEYWFNIMDQKAWKFWFIRWRMGFQLALYGDLGTTWTQYQELENNWIGGYGAGFRLTIPAVTLIRLDMGYGQAGLGVRMYVGGGEKADAQKDRVR